QKPAAVQVQTLRSNFRRTNVVRFLDQHENPCPWGAFPRINPRFYLQSDRTQATGKSCKGFDLCQASPNGVKSEVERQKSAICYPSTCYPSTSRTLRDRFCSVKGFCRKAVPLSMVPSLTIVSSVYPER